MIARGLDPDAIPGDVELKREWFKEDDFGEAYDSYMEARRIAIESGMNPGEEAALDIEF